MKNSRENCDLCSNYDSMCCPLSFADLDEDKMDIIEKCCNYENKCEENVLTILNRMEEDIRDLRTYLNLVISKNSNN